MMSKSVAVIAALCTLSFIPGCTTTAAKKAMNKPNKSDSYTAFDAGASDSSKRKSEKVEPIKEDMDAEVAVTKLVEQMQRQEPAYTLSAEEQLRMWGTKQGVDKIVYNKVRLLLKNQRVEIRAPALRLTKLFGGREAIPDLIECLGDPEVAIRQEAFNALHARTKKDFSYSPNGGEVARWKSVEDWRQWWQVEQRKVAVQPASVYEEKPQAEPKIVAPKVKN